MPPKNRWLVSDGWFSAKDPTKTNAKTKNFWKNLNKQNVGIINYSDIGDGEMKFSMRNYRNIPRSEIKARRSNHSTEREWCQKISSASEVFVFQVESFENIIYNVREQDLCKVGNFKKKMNINHCEKERKLINKTGTGPG